jgi:hypothetical protein
VQPVLSVAPPIDSPEFWERPYRVPASSDPDTLTAQTISIMCGHIADGSHDSQVILTANDALRFLGVGGVNSNEGASDRDLAGAAWWWLKVYVKFVHHEFIIRRRLGEGGQHPQGLIAPEVLVRMKHPEGDCAIFTECLCAFLKVYGIPYEIVTVAVNPNEPEVYSHVYLYAVLSDGSRLPLDASHGDYPGWQVPSSHVTRRQVWDSNGNPVADKGSRFDGLHNYGLRGLGDVCTPSDFDFDPTACSNIFQTVTSSPQLPCTCLNGTCLEDGNSCSSPSTGSLPAGALTVPNQNSAQWASFATQLAKMGFTLAQQNSLKPGQVILPNGTILQQAPGLPVPFSTTLNQLGTSLTAGGSSTLLLVGLGALALLMFTGKK